MKLAITTGGGDAPGLNAVIRAIVHSADALGWEVHGIRRGYDGILMGMEDGVFRLTKGSVRGITHLGGTILGTTNRGDPFEYKGGDGARKEDRSEDVVKALKDRGIDALIAIGGDGSLGIASRFAKMGVKVVGVPKTIDNDLASTQETFGFATAVETATEAIDKLHSTAEAHRRVFVVELMGRHTGWITLYAGVAGTADVILIPEIPYDIEKIVEKVEQRYAGGREFAIIVVAEGAKPAGGSAVYQAEGRYGGVAERLSADLSRVTGHESRSLVLGHLQRGGPPNAYDRLLALRFGAAAVRLVNEGKFGTMVAINPPKVEAVPLEDAVRELKRVPVDHDVVQTARALGVCFGD